MFKIRGGAQPSRSPGGAAKVTAIVLSLPRRSTLAGWSSMDWADINAKLRGFPSLRTLVVGFACQDDMRHFTEDVVKNYMPSFLDRLRVAAWDPSGGALHDGSWLRVIPTKDTEGGLYNVQYGSRGPNTRSDTPGKLEDSGIPVLQKVYSMV